MGSPAGAIDNSPGCQSWEPCAVVGASPAGTAEGKPIPTPFSPFLYPHLFPIWVSSRELALSLPKGAERRGTCTWRFYFCNLNVQFPRCARDDSIGEGDTVIVKMVGGRGRTQPPLWGWATLVYILVPQDWRPGLRSLAPTGLPFNRNTATLKMP